MLKELEKTFRNQDSLNLLNADYSLELSELDESVLFFYNRKRSPVKSRTINKLPATAKERYTPYNLLEEREMPIAR